MDSALFLDDDVPTLRRRLGFRGEVLTGIPRGPSHLPGGEEAAFEVHGPASVGIPGIPCHVVVTTFPAIEWPVHALSSIVMIRRDSIRFHASVQVAAGGGKNAPVPGAAMQEPSRSFDSLLSPPALKGSAGPPEVSSGTIVRVALQKGEAPSGRSGRREGRIVTVF